MAFWFEDTPPSSTDRRASELVYHEALAAIEGPTPLWGEASAKTGPRSTHAVTVDEAPLVRFTERHRLPLGALVVAAHALVLARAARETHVLVGVRRGDGLVVPVPLGLDADESSASFVSRIDARVRYLGPHAKMGGAAAAMLLSSVVVSGAAPFDDADLVLRVEQHGPSLRLSVEHD